MKEPATGSAGSVRAADLRRGQSPPDAIHRVIIKLVVIIGFAFPVTDIGFVPNFPVPLFYFRPPVLFDAMFCPLETKLAPFCVILGRITETHPRVKRSFRRRVMRIILVRRSTEGQCGSQAGG